MKDPILFKLFKNFVFEIYPLLNSALDKKIIKPKYDKCPSLKHKNNWMPSISLYNAIHPFRIYEDSKEFNEDRDSQKYKIPDDASAIRMVINSK